MTNILNFALKIKGVVGKVAHAQSSDPAIPSKFGKCTKTYLGCFLCFLETRISSDLGRATSNV